MSIERRILAYQPVNNDRVQSFALYRSMTLVIMESFDSTLSTDKMQQKRQRCYRTFR